ncbi:arsenate reductase (azurin) small subunit [Stygiolobus caldivivus]|uniref:Arsenite oxidase small subunit n=1 Tax=Stygiolobus caldivivus TaxID=2824673 RepID=A0A8D5ZHW3_9CREN|nr:arsenate reductase (azurin) small subunit [Stygiolobus caldivivus]BCU68940.1 arsenite oxidase small subunit [Stygiolobus caldivivus]
MSKDKGVDSNRRAVIIGGAAAIAGIAAGIVIGGNAFPRTTVEEKPITSSIVKEEIGTSTTTVTQTVTSTTSTTAPPVSVPVAYVRQKVANYSQLQVGTPITTNYMGYTVYIVRTGVPSVGGVGPNGDVVGYSAYCAHMGYILEYDPNTRCMLCPQHFSQYDATAGGMQVVGHPNQFLPQLILEYDESTGDIYAVGFNRLVYGTYNTAAQASSSPMGES